MINSGNEWDWMEGATGPYYDKNKFEGDPKLLKGIIKEFMSRIDNMEDFLMEEAYSSIIEDKNFILYPYNEIEEYAIQDLINYYTDREQYERCAKIVKYLEEGKQYKSKHNENI